MAEEINQLLKIEIDQKAVNDAIAKATEAKRSIDSLRQANKELAKAEGDNTEAIVKNNIEIKKHSAIVRENEKIVVSNKQAQAANTGSIEQLRKQLSVVTVQWKNLSKEERENENIGGKLAKQKLELTNILKAEEKATGDTRRNVGNYTEGVKEALTQSGLFGRQMQQLKQAQAAYTLATKGSTKGLKAFRLALMATGIGAIVVLLGSLISAFASTQEGIDKVTSVTRPLITIFQKVKGLVQDLATNVFSGLGKILNGDIKEGLKDLGGAFKDAGAGLGDAIREGAKAGAELDRLQKQIEKTEIELIKRRAELNAEFERSKEIAQDDTKSEEERRVAAQKAIEAQNELLKQEQEFLDLRIEKKKLENSLNDTSREDLKELAELEAQRTQAEALASRKRVSARNLLETIDKQANADAIKRAKERNEAELEIQKERSDQEEIIREEVEAKATRVINDELVRLKELYAEGLIDKQKFEDEKLRIEREALETARLTAEIAKQNALDDLTISEAERVRIIAEADDQILAIRERTAEAQIRLNEKAADTGIKINDEETKTKKDNTNELLNLAKNASGEQTVLSKTAGIAQATISSYTAAANALKDLPFPFNIATAALVTAKGLANVAKISSINAVGFAGGGYTGDGFGVPDSSGYKPAGFVHEKEYVIPKWQTESPKFAPIINYLESSRLKGYADGGLVGRSATLDVNQSSQLSALQTSIEMIGQMQPIVRVTDINRVSKESQMVKVSGALS